MGGEGDFLVINQFEDGTSLGVTFTAEDHEAVAEWVRGKAAQGDVVATPTRLYLPVYTSMTVVEDGDRIWFDTASDRDNAFKVERA